MSLPCRFAGYITVKFIAAATKPLGGLVNGILNLTRVCRGAPLENVPNAMVRIEGVGSGIRPDAEWMRNPTQSGH